MRATLRPRRPSRARRPPRAKKAPKGAKKAAGARDGSKTATILEMLKRSGGATAKELLKATGWQAHSLRGFLSGTVGKKLGLTVVSDEGRGRRAQLFRQSLIQIQRVSFGRRIQLRRLFLSLLRFEDSPFGVPVRQRQAQARQVRIAREDLRFDRGDLAFAAFDWRAIHSRRRSRAFQRNLVERVAAVENGLLAGVLLDTAARCNPRTSDRSP